MPVRGRKNFAPKGVPLTQIPCSRIGKGSDSPALSDVRLLFLSPCFMFCFFGLAAVAQEPTERNVVVTADEAGEEFEEPGGYGQPQWAERSRASATTKLYVLSPYELFVGIVSESDFLRSGGARHDLKQEIEFGLPSRFELDLENHLGLAGGDVAETQVDLGVRYAFATWSKIPLNPTISAQYLFGTGHDVANRFASTGNAREPRKRADAFEIRLLLGQEFVPRLQWAANVFFQDELGGPLNRGLGFTQDIAWLAIADKLELGAEMRYTHATRRADRIGPANEFVIGPSMNWKPNLHTVLSVAPLFGCTSDSPDVAVLASISFEFGGGESKTVPHSATQNH